MVVSGGRACFVALVLLTVTAMGPGAAAGGQQPSAGDACRDAVPSTTALCVGFDAAADQAQHRCPLLSDTITLVCAMGRGNAQEATVLCRHTQEIYTGPGPECKLAESFIDGGGQLCLFATGSGACGVLRTHAPDPALVDAFEAGALAASLALQRRLSDDLPLVAAPWVSTHNSFNAAVYDPTLSGLDPNQYYSLSDQLRMGVREIELDPHWMPSIYAGGAPAPVLCHGRPPEEGHVGCTTEVLLETRLGEIRAWLDANPSEVIMIEINDRIGAAAGYDATASALEAALGDRVYRPAASSRACSDGLPLEVSRSDVRAAGKQVILTADVCGSGSAYAALVHDHSPRINGGTPTSNDCVVPAGDYASNVVRYHEDSTMVDAVVSAGETRFDAADVSRLDRCGTNMISLDRIHPEDPRLAALAWVWDEFQPATGNTDDCAAHMPGGRLTATDCSRQVFFACRDASGWTFTAARGAWYDGSAACAASGAAFDVPRSAADNEALKSAKAAAGALAVWVNLTDAGADGHWRVG